MGFVAVQSKTAVSTFDAHAARCKGASIPMADVAVQVLDKVSRVTSHAGDCHRARGRKKGKEEGEEEGEEKGEGEGEERELKLMLINCLILKLAVGIKR